MRNKEMVETPAMKQWQAIKSKYPESVLFFQLGDFYEFFNEDAIEMSNALELKLTSRGKDKNAVPLAGIPIRAVDIYIPRLLEKGYSVVIADQLKTPEKIEGKLIRHPAMGLEIVYEFELPILVRQAIVFHSKEGDKIPRLPEVDIIHRCDFLCFAPIKQIFGNSN